MGMTRAAKLSLLNFLSLFRELQKSTRFSVGGVVAEFFRVLQKPMRFSGGGGGVVPEFFSAFSGTRPLSSVAESHFYPTPETHIFG